MPLTDRTERALEACYDAILAPTRWSSALQSLAESFGAASCMFFEHDRENSPAPAPMSEGHVAFADRLTRNWAHAPDPHVGPYLQKCNSFQRGGWASVPGARSLDRGRAPRNSFLSGNSATGEAGMDGGVLFLGRRPQLVLAGLPRRRPVYARTRRTPLPGSDPLSAKSSVWPKSFRAAYDLTSKLSALERVSSAAVVIDATGRADAR